MFCGDYQSHPTKSKNLKTKGSQKTVSETKKLLKVYTSSAFVDTCDVTKTDSTLAFLFKKSTRFCGL